MIESRRLAPPKMSVSKAAKLAKISEGRWRQLAKGYQQATAETRIAAKAPAETLARMANAVGVTAEELEEVGRTDAASIVREPLPAGPSGTATPERKTPDTVADAWHLSTHSWSVAEEFIAALAGVDCPPVVKQAAARLLTVYGEQIVLNILQYDIPSRDRDAILADHYKHRYEAQQLLGETHVMEAAAQSDASGQAHENEEVSASQAQDTGLLAPGGVALPDERATGGANEQSV